MATTNQKATRDIQEIKRKEPKHNTTESHQHTEESKTIRKEQRSTKKNEKTVNWQWLQTYRLL